MKKIGWIIFLTVLTQAQQMKCAPGKCGGGSVSEMKCAPGKCGGGAATEQKSHNTVVKGALEQHFNIKTTKPIEKITALTKRFDGVLKADESLVYDITLRYGGYIEKLYADKTFQYIKQGDQIATIYSPELYRAKLEYLSSLKFHRKHPSKKMVNAAKQKLKLFGLNSSEIKRIATMGEADETTTVYAPKSGYIIRKHVNEGGYVPTSKPLVTLQSFERLWADIRVFQEDLEIFKSLAHFKICLDGTDMCHKTDQIELLPVAEPKARYLVARATLHHPDKLFKPGLIVRVHASGTPTKKLLLKKSAVIYKAGKSYLFLKTPFKGLYDLIEVKVKPFDKHYVEVAEGLSPNDEVVDNAHFFLDADAQISGLYEKSHDQ